VSGLWMVLDYEQPAAAGRGHRGRPRLTSARGARVAGPRRRGRPAPPAAGLEPARQPARLAMGVWPGWARARGSGRRSARSWLRWRPPGRRRAISASVIRTWTPGASTPGSASGLSRFPAWHPAPTSSTRLV